MQLVPDIIFNWRSGLDDELIVYSVSVITQKQNNNKNRSTRLLERKRLFIRGGSGMDLLHVVAGPCLFVAPIEAFRIFFLLTSSNVFMASKQ